MGIFNVFNSEKRSLKNNSEQPMTMKELQELISNSTSSDIDLSDNAIMQLPAINSCIELISNLVASVSIELYEKKDNKIKEITEDKRLYLLNHESEEFLTAYESRKLFIRDFFMYGSAFLHKKQLGVGEIALEYLDREELSFYTMNDNDKDFDIMHKGKRIPCYDLIYAFRNSHKVTETTSIINDNKDLFTNMLYANEYKKNLTMSGGLQKILVQPNKTLKAEFLNILSQKIKSLYKGTDNVLVLNSDVDIKPIVSDKSVSVENLSKDYDNQVKNIFGVSDNIINGNSSNEEFNNFIRTKIVPLLIQLEQAYNRALLLESEKGNKYFKFNIDGLLRTSMKERYESYAIAVKNGILGVNEIRQKEDYEPIENLEGLIRLNLADALLDVNNGKLVNINTNTVLDLNTKEVSNFNN